MGTFFGEAVYNGPASSGADWIGMLRSVYKVTGNCPRQMTDMIGADIGCAKALFTPSVEIIPSSISIRLVGWLAHKFQ